MAKSKFEYTRNFEINDSLLPQTWIVVRLDGQGFHKFTDAHNFTKPNDDRGLGLMNKSALEVMKVIPDISLAYGQSDEFSFVFKRDSYLHNRRSSKLISIIASKFTSNYLFYWREFFPDQALEYPPSFDARTVCYPSIEALRDYLSWRQADCHINNLYNICFWKLVQDGETKQQAQLILKGTESSDKNEILFTRFNTNYSQTPAIHRKGSVIYKPKIACNNSFHGEASNEEKDPSPPQKLRWGKLGVYHIDIIQDKFWNENPHLLEVPRRR